MAGNSEIEERAKLRVGRVLKGKWRLESLLGIGGMAAVYGATHRQGKRVAVKILHPDLSRSSAQVRRFLREAYAVNQIDHPGVVTVSDDDIDDDGCVFFVMDLLDGVSLEEHLEAKGGRLAPRAALEISEQLLDVIAAAHDKGIVHRDLKPANLLLTRDGKVKVLDFGIARLREVADVPGATTKDGVIMGTPAYMPPEQAKGRWNEVDARTDVWAVGATMFTMLTGELVHGGETTNEQLARAATRQATPLDEVLAEIHPDLARVVDRALEFEQSDRFQTAREMREALRLIASRIRESLGPLPLSSGAVPVITADAPTLDASSPGLANPRSPETSPGWTSPSGDRRRTRLRWATLGVVAAFVGAASVAVVMARREPEALPQGERLAVSIPPPVADIPAPQPSAESRPSPLPVVTPSASPAPSAKPVRTAREAPAKKAVTTAPSRARSEPISTPARAAPPTKAGLLDRRR